MSSNKIGYFVITRFNIPIKYGPGGEKIKGFNPCIDEEYLQKRFRLFEQYTLPSVMNQTMQSFKWIVCFYKHTPLKNRLQIEKYQTLYNSFRPLFMDEEDVAHFSERISEVIGETECDYYITTRIDNDDAVSQNYFSSILEYMKMEKIYRGG